MLARTELRSLTPTLTLILIVYQVGLAAAWPWDKAEPVEEEPEGNLLIPLALGAAIVIVVLLGCSAKPREGRQTCRRRGRYGRYGRPGS